MKQNSSKILTIQSFLQMIRKVFLTQNFIQTRNQYPF